MYSCCLLANNSPSTLCNSLTIFLANLHRWLIQPHYWLSSMEINIFWNVTARKRILKSTVIWKEPTAKSRLATVVGKKIQCITEPSCTNSKTCCINSKDSPLVFFVFVFLLLFKNIHHSLLQGLWFFFLTNPSNLQDHTIYLELFNVSVV